MMAAASSARTVNARAQGDLIAGKEGLALAFLNEVCDATVLFPVC
jgi:hypothetical protein